MEGKRMFVFILLLTTSVLDANALSQACLESRIACFDTWQGTNQDCSATRNYNDCIRRVKQRGVCDKDAVTVEEIYEASVDCGFIPRRKRHVFPEFDDSQHKNLPRFIDSDGTKMYEFVFNRPLKFNEASEFCRKAGGSLFIPRHHYNILSLDAFLRRNIVLVNNQHYYYIGPNQNSNGNYPVGLKSNAGGKFWVGASDTLKEGDYRFEDGSILAWDFFAHYQGIHDTGFFSTLRRRGQDCVTMDFDTLHGYVRDCNEKRSFVCQYRGYPKH